MTSRSLRSALLVGAMGAALVVPAGPIATASPAAVTTTTSDVRATRLASGPAGLVGYTARHTATGHVEPGSPLPGRRISRTSAALRGVAADGGYLASWLAPGTTQE